MTDNRESDSDPATEKSDSIGEPSLVLDDADATLSGPDADLVTILQLDSMEAELACAKLHSEGIPACLAGKDLAVMNPLIFANVRLQVRRSDVDLAQQILSRPVSEDADGEYADEDWRCPKCHRKTVDLLPMPPTWRRIRNGWLVVLLLPLAWRCIHGITGLLDLGDLGLAGPLLFWASIIMVGGLSLLFRRRTKRCRQCGFLWLSGQEKESSEGT